MSTVPKILLFLSLAATVAEAGLPSQADVFTIASFTPPKTNYVSADYIFSALPHYEPVQEHDSLTDYPSHKNAATQQGAIVLRNKTVLFFDTRSSRYLDVIDSSGHSTFYRLAKAPSIRRDCPKPPSDIDAIPFPKEEDVFCVAMYPWNHGKHFTPETLVEAIPHFRPLTQRDVPGKAILTATDAPIYHMLYPSQWVQASRENEPLNGILVLTNRAVLKWFAWSARAIHFENYRQNTFFVIDE